MSILWRIAWSCKRKTGKSSWKRRRNLPSSLLSASLHLAVLHESLWVLICLFSVDRISTIMVRELSCVVGIIVQHMNKRFHSAYPIWLYVAQNCMLWHISPQSAEAIVFWSKELFLMASIALPCNMFLECVFSWVFCCFLFGWFFGGGFCCFFVFL